MEFDTDLDEVEDRTAVITFNRLDQLNTTFSGIAIASERAVFSEPHVSIGLVSDQEMVRLDRVPPTGISMRIAPVGRHVRMAAQRAYDLGLIAEVAHDRPLERGKELAALVNRNAPLAVRDTQLAIRKGLDLPLHEAKILAETCREPVHGKGDAKEGQAAFMDKRDPEWTAS